MSINMDSPLCVKREGDELVIRVGVGRVNGSSYHPEIPELDIVDIDIWINDVIAEMVREDEQGCSLLIDFIDKSMINAIENGSTGLSENSVTHMGECVKCGDYTAVGHQMCGEICKECLKKID